MSNITFITYDATGRILCLGSCPESQVENAEIHAASKGWHVAQVVGQVDLLAHYAPGGDITPRPGNPAALNGHTLSSLPAPCRISVNGEAFDCNEPSATLTLPPGEYPITVSAWPYLDANFTLRV
jgi:hypothetical protein